MFITLPPAHFLTCAPALRTGELRLEFMPRLIESGFQRQRQVVQVVKGQIVPAFQQLCAVVEVGGGQG